MMTDEALFDLETPPPVSLADKFLFPPLSILDRRAGAWGDRKAKWLSMGIRSELGREAALIESLSARVPNYYWHKTAAEERIGRKLTNAEFEAEHLVMPTESIGGSGVSVFDPVLCELTYRWFSAPGGVVLDPFAGGSVRGVVASVLARQYIGVDLRSEQIEANREQAHLGSPDFVPTWVHGDSTDLDHALAGDDLEADLVFTCPPYADLEVYSDDPADLSTMPYEEFLAGYASAMQQATERLRRDRFAAVVISDVRDKKSGAYRGLVADTVGIMQALDLELWNDCVLVDQAGPVAMRAERPFRATRKVGRTHQHLLVFLKGDARKATHYVTGDDTE